MCTRFLSRNESWRIVLSLMETMVLWRYVSFTSPPSHLRSLTQLYSYLKLSSQYGKLNAPVQKTWLIEFIRTYAFYFLVVCGFWLFEYVDHWHLTEFKFGLRIADSANPIPLSKSTKWMRINKRLEPYLLRGWSRIIISSNKLHFSKDQDIYIGASGC